MNEWSIAEDKNESLSLLLAGSQGKGANRQQRYPQHRFFGLCCSYFPEELVMAFGLDPLRMLPESGNATPAELPSFSCSLARGLWDMEKGDKWQDLVGVGFVHTCDTMQCLSGIWEFAGKTNVITIVPPVMLKATGGVAFYQKEIEGAWEKLKYLTGQNPSHEKLREAMDLCQKIREQVQKLDEIRPFLPSPLVPAILRAGQLMPKNQYLEALTEIVAELKEDGTLKEQAAQDKRVKLMITGAILESDSLYNMIEDLGGRVVADDTCTGSRHFSGKYEESKEPFADLVDRYLNMDPCPCKNKSLNERIDLIRETALKNKAEGVIILIRKYCEPHAWDGVALEEDLQKAGLRTFTLELDAAEVGGQERTRLQAFIESVQELRDTEEKGGEFR